MNEREQLDLFGGATPVEELTWTCADCGHENPAGAIFCRGCASTQDDDPEPQVGGYNHAEGHS